MIEQQVSRRCYGSIVKIREIRRIHDNHFSYFCGFCFFARYFFISNVYPYLKRSTKVFLIFCATIMIWFWISEYTCPSIGWFDWLHVVFWQKKTNERGTKVRNTFVSTVFTYFYLRLKIFFTPRFTTSNKLNDLTILLGST